MREMSVGARHWGSVAELTVERLLGTSLLGNVVADGGSRYRVRVCRHLRCILHWVKKSGTAEIVELCFLRFRLFGLTRRRGRFFVGFTGGVNITYILVIY